ncbi:probable transcriptional regulator [Roseobacter sp. SK209-2-6]|uniref:LysR substrate-binding domain-containing protein n=1 Tax=Roseobacter sp. SK209-2-6 TaxID=388739 RepID=UPI0000F3E766|nr:LysR substrate-binding domain-containing protein [Roseobacter sp. SK209-2-6]EBA16311.1 probable transcriptional regulator [Roseobacter sp. SK209-2-6]
MTDLPPLNGLRAFDVSGRRLSFRAAADEMGVTQGAVAQQVRQLESHLGVLLFDRLPKGLALTAAGRLYHNRISGAFEELRAATAQLKPEPGKVLISVTPSFASKWLIPNLPGFAEEHPEIDLRILATEKISSFHSDGIDLAIRQGAPPFGATLNAQLLFKQEIIAVAAPDLIASTHAAIEDPDADLIDLAGLPKIHDAHDLWPSFLAEIAQEEKSQRHLRLSQTALAVDAAISGQGVALVNRFLAARDIEAGKLVEVGAYHSAVGQDFYLLSLRRPTAQAQVAAVIAWLTAQATTL